MATSSNDMSTNSSLQQNLNVVNHMPYAALPKSTAPTASSAAPNKVSFILKFCFFVVKKIARTTSYNFCTIQFLILL